MLMLQPSFDLLSLFPLSSPLSASSHPLLDDSSSDGSDSDSDSDLAEVLRPSSPVSAKRMSSEEGARDRRSGPSRERQLAALRHCIELLERAERPVVYGATGEAMRL
ncbi:hypothetical protein GUITHDRAFT_149125 [Guillardia theta CCMP2712]|uniref:Uncharacterized protein n=1 Tax=Guillardia theta (strain CCMP2712) TaxID=905079 RepID=L1I770_GUITC|nr:hypothetical protein GUITHDRAFT_149125 [Guillardia theta CCMP2712]EKX31710.1 hypothetical protein GUITHDRAFT_149125 [Guillardia theta CCMP2712]|eukprot:XP_005818690.1 hypothetical protein GUITHDRAFT_149125 [Guillardia theta CCMP2712]